MAKKISDKAQLTGKQQLFAKYYVGEAALNATRAARLAGYGGDDNALAAAGSRLLRNVKIRNDIDGQLKDLVASSFEVLTILTKQAKGSLADVLNSKGEFDLADAKKRGVDVLLKEIEIIETETKDGEIRRKFKYKIHDAQAAAVHLGKVHGLFVEKVDVTIPEPQWQTAVKMLLSDPASGVSNVKEALDALRKVQFSGLPIDLDDSILSATELI